MKFKSILFVFALFVVFQPKLNAQNLALASISGEAYKRAPVSAFAAAIGNEMNISFSGKPIPYFEEDLQRRLDALVPAWLKDAGAMNLAQWNAKQADEDELAENRDLNRSVSIMASTSDQLKHQIGGKKKKEKINGNIEVRLRDLTNEYAEKLDRDYLMFVRVVASHQVSKKKLDKPLKVGKKLNGAAVIIVAVIDAADATIVASDIKSVNANNSPGGLSISTSVGSEALANKTENIVKRVYRKFVNKTSK